MSDLLQELRRQRLSFLAIARQPEFRDLAAEAASAPPAERLQMLLALTDLDHLRARGVRLPEGSQAYLEISADSEIALPLIEPPDSQPHAVTVRLCYTYNPFVPIPTPVPEDSWVPKICFDLTITPS